MLEFITTKKDTFLAVAQVFEKYKETSLPLTSSALKNIVLCREKDLKRLQEVITTVQKLQFFFKEIGESKLTYTTALFQNDFKILWKLAILKKICMYKMALYNIYIKSWNWITHEKVPIIFIKQFLFKTIFLKQHRQPSYLFSNVYNKDTFSLNWNRQHNDLNIQKPKKISSLYLSVIAKYYFNIGTVKYSFSLFWCYC